MAFDQYSYGDPLQVAMRRQAKSCHGCKYEWVSKLNRKVAVCMNGRTYGKKCRVFIEKGIK